MKAQIDRGFRKAAARLAGAVLLAFALAPSPASAQTIWTMTGHGFGHGVGMSQYGAYGYAQHGWSAQQILSHYYPGTTVGKAPVSRVRVLLADKKKTLKLSSDVPFSVRDGLGKTHTLAAGAVSFGATMLPPLLAQGLIPSLIDQNR